MIFTNWRFTEITKKYLLGRKMNKINEIKILYIFSIIILKIFQLYLIKHYYCW